MGQADNASTALRIGCETGDDDLCARYLEAAQVTEDKAQRDWMIEHVRKARAEHSGSAK